MQSSDPVSGLDPLDVIIADLPPDEIGMITRDEIHLLMALRQHRNNAHGDPDRGWLLVNTVRMIAHRAGKAERL